MEVEGETFKKGKWRCVGAAPAIGRCAGGGQRRRAIGRARVDRVHLGDATNRFFLNKSNFPILLVGAMFL